MGRQYGAALAAELGRCLDLFCPFLRGGDDDKIAARLDPLETLLRRMAPALWQETQGMADGAGIAPRQMLAYRFFPEVRAALTEGCSAFYLAHSDAGPLLGRNADLEDDLSQEIQVCHVCRPTHGPARVTTTYVGLTPTSGFNAHGLGLGGTSAHAADYAPDADGVPAGVLAFLLLEQCATLDDADALLAQHRFRGKSLNLLIGDAAGRARVYECVPGHVPHAVTPPTPRDWAACTNSFLSGRWKWLDESKYQECSFARYGRITQRLHDGQVDYRVEGAQDLLRQVAMPGPICTGFDGTWKTAYSGVMCLAQQRMLLAPGHPAEAPFEEVKL